MLTTILFITLSALLLYWGFRFFSKAWELISFFIKNFDVEEYDYEDKTEDLPQFKSEDHNIPILH